MAKANIYLNFKGNCEEAFNFYKSVFGGDFDYFSRYKDMPANDEHKIEPIDIEKVLHVSLKLSEGHYLMGCDLASNWEKHHVTGSNFHISIDAEPKEETDKIFKALSEDGQVMMPLNETFWGSYFGMFTDKFGIGWMVSCDVKK